MTHIRPAAPADRTLLVALVQQSLAWAQTLSPWVALTPQHTWRRVVAAQLHQSDGQIFVATRDGRVVGYVIVQVRGRPRRHGLWHWVRQVCRWRPQPAFVQPHTVGWIEDCYVQPQERQQGIGMALVQAGLDWLQAQQVQRVELGVATANQAGLAFWQRQGFAPVRLRMARMLAPPAAAGSPPEVCNVRER